MAQGNLHDEVIRTVTESKLYFMSRPTNFTKVEQTGRVLVTMWLERSQRKVYYR